VVRGKRWADYLELAAFFDYGQGWNTDRPTGDPPDLSGVGIGLRWGPFVSQIRTELPELVEPIHRLYADFLLCDEEFRDFRVEIRRRGASAAAEFVLDHSELAALSRPSPRHARMGIELVRLQYHHTIVIHSAVVAREDRAPALRAARSGKTLCAT
jgi:hypothetical protein